MEALSKSILLSILRNPKDAPRNNLRCDCVFCGKSGHMFVYTGVKGQTAHPFICHKCKESGDIYKLLKKLDKLYLIDGERITSGLKVIDLSVGLAESDDEIDLSELNDIKMPIGSKRIYFDDESDATKYLIGRGFTRQDFDETKPHVTDLKQKLIGYVLFPIEKDYRIKAYIGRDTLPASEDRLRYRNSISQFSRLMYGYDRLNRKTKYIILVEGIFDAIAINRKLNLYEQDEIVVLCTFGNKISREQMKMLSRYSLDICYLMYDVRDSVEIMKKYGAILSEQFTTRICYLKSGDPDESTDEQILHAIYHSESYVEFKYHKVQEKKKF